MISGTQRCPIRSSDVTSNIENTSRFVFNEILHGRGDNRLEFRILRQIFNSLSHQCNIEINVGQSRASGINRKRKQ